MLSAVVAVAAYIQRFNKGKGKGRGVLLERTIIIDLMLQAVVHRPTNS
jgi:hypothetical protein